MTAPLESPIAVRRLLVVGEPGRTITVTLGQPRPDENPSGDWICPVVIEGLGSTAEPDLVHGVDAFQAMLLAMERIRSGLDASGLTLAMEGEVTGETGFPRMVPSLFGRAFAQKIESHIDREIEAFAQAAEEAAARARG